MASTYTPKLTLEKPGHGEAVGTWDAVLNANFDALDAAAWATRVLTEDPADPAEGETWVRSDLGQFRVRVGGQTLKADLATP